MRRANSLPTGCLPHPLPPPPTHTHTPFSSPAQFYKYTAPAAGFVTPWACSSGFNVTLFVDDGSGGTNCIGPFNGCNDPLINDVDSQTM